MTKPAPALPTSSQLPGQLSRALIAQHESGKLAGRSAALTECAKTLDAEAALTDGHSAARLRELARLFRRDADGDLARAIQILEEAQRANEARP